MAVIAEAFNQLKETTRHCMALKHFKDCEYKITCYIWIINDKNQILVRQRGGHLKTNPNLWETISTVMEYLDNISSNAAVRIVKEEYGLDISKDDLTYIGCYKRTKDFVDVWLVNTTATKKKFNLRADKAQDMQWISPKKYEQMIKDGIALNTSYDIFRKYYKNFYKK